MKVYYAAPAASPSPFLKFLGTLDHKLRRKLMTQLILLITTPNLGEPHVKHFTISKYSSLFELRTRSKIMVRIIFTIREDGDILLLEPFVKRHKRNTMQALDASLKLLRQIDSGNCSIQELAINRDTLEVIT